MSLVSTVVFLSQSVRTLAIRLQSKAIRAIERRIKQVESEQVKVEEHRSNLMVRTHKKYYEAKGQHMTEYNEALAKLESKFTQRLNKLDSAFADDKAVIALTHQAASNELKRELAMLGSELDHLTK